MYRSLYTAVMVILLTMLASTALMAAEPTSLYSAQVMVTSQDAKQRQQGIQTALAEVLVRVSGNSDVLSVPKVSHAMQAESDSLLESYSYDTTESDQGEQQLWLTARFDKRGIVSLLRQAGQAVWVGERPTVLVWLAQADNQERRLIGAESDPEIQTMLNKDGQRRGLNVVLPLLDLQDMQHASVNDVWVPFPWVLTSASKRYDTETLLIGKVTQQNQQYNGQWLFMNEGEKMTWQSQASDEQSLLANAVDYVANVMAARYASLDANPSQGHVAVTVYGVNGLARLSAVSRYLKQLTSVTNVNVDSFAEDHVTFNVAINSSVPVLEQSINMEHFLLPIQDYSQPQGNEISLRYQLAA